MLELPADFVRKVAGVIPAYAATVYYTASHSQIFAETIADRAQEHVSDETAVVDCAVLRVDDGAWDDAGMRAQFARIAPNGSALLLALPNGVAPTLEQLADHLARGNFALYRHHAIVDEATSSTGYLAFAVRADYNPLLHARELLKTGHAGWAFDILANIPEEFLVDPTTRAHIGVEKQICLLAWDRTAGPAGRLGRFFNCQAVFYDAVAHCPTLHEAYLCQAEFWRRIGKPAMRSRLLRSVCHVAPAPQLSSSLHASREKPNSPIIAPEWQGSKRTPRILYITHPRPHYGLDVLYDGLCEVLGDDRVLDFPYKPTLHGEPPEELGHYPCLFSRPAQPVPLTSILEQLAARAFDAVIWGDVEDYLMPEEVRAITKAAGDTPMVLLDQQDDPMDRWAAMNALVGPPGFKLYLKREMLDSWEYGEHTVPVPFAYPASRISHVADSPRANTVFWAGHRQYGLRRLYLEHIESVFRFDLGRNFTQEEYSRALSSSAIGLNIFGFGFDTVRYWEIPAHGALLLAERVPIHIPYNFVDGESAVFFDDLPELEEKLRHYLQHPEEAAQIARRGHEHLLRHHTSAARARQVLGHLEAAGLI